MNHECGMATNLAMLRAQIGEHGYRGNVPSVVEGKVNRQGFEHVVEADPLTYSTAGRLEYCMQGLDASHGGSAEPGKNAR
jgi:hypothetical protein